MFSPYLHNRYASMYRHDKVTTYFSMLTLKINIKIAHSAQATALQCINSQDLTHPDGGFEPAIFCSKCLNADHHAMPQF
jgi:hypothetical protein